MVSPGAFAGTKIKKIVMTNITALYGYTFERSGVHSVEMPFVKSLDISEFEGCEELTEVKFSDNLRSIGECCFLECRELGEITIPDTLTEIGPRAFEGCWNLDTIRIVQPNGNIIGKKGEARLPSRLRRVSYAAFESCSMYTLYIPNSVKSIDDYAFSHCNTLSTVIIDKTNTDALYTSIIPFGYRGTAKIIRVKDGDSFQEEEFCNGMYISYPLKKRKRC
jgi:hypothetical protein